MYRSSSTRRGNLFRLLGPILFATLAACGGDGGQEPFQPEEPTDSTDNGGTVQRGELVVTVGAEGDAATVVQSLGGSAGAVSAVDVTIQRVGESERSSATTDEEGRVTFDELLPGHYRVTALRLLTDEEAAEVDAGNPSLPEVSALGGGATVELDPPSAQAEVQLGAGYRGTLTVSEVHDWSPIREGGVSVQYSQAKYVEVSNNSDRPVYLDGKILAKGLWYVTSSSSSPNKCEELEQWRLDPEGIWSEMHLRFPGSGALHRLRPGEAAVIAITAIDHGEIHDGMPDLSDADFEIVGPGQDVDNPNVPNMIDVGTHPAVDALGRGYLFAGRLTLMIVDNVDLETLPTDRLPLSDPDYRRFPGDKILGLATLLGNEPVGTEQYCDRIVNERFDRQAARIMDPLVGNSVQRKVLGMTPEGVAILQRTNTSAADFERGTRSPGRVP